MSDSEKTACRFVYPSQELIYLVKKRPEVWCRKAEGYKLPESRREAWRAITRKINTEYDTMSSREKLEEENRVIKRWNNVRDTYRKHLLNITKNKSNRPYIYAQDLSFLKDQFKELRPKQTIHIKRRIVRSKSTSESEREEESTYLEDDSNSNMASWMECEETPIFTNIKEEISREPETPEKQSTRSSVDCANTPVENNLLSVLTKLLRKEEDEDRAFFKSIFDHVKALPTENKMKFRIGVMQLLTELSKNDKNKSRESKRTADGSESD